MTTTFTQPPEQIHPDFARFVNHEVLPLTGLDRGLFWDDFARLMDDFAPVYSALLIARRQLRKTDTLAANDQQPALSGKPSDKLINIRCLSGPPLVTSLHSAEATLNSANARWGSLYEALIHDDELIRDSALLRNWATGARQQHLNPTQQAIHFGKQFLDNVFPLQQGSHADVANYLVYFNHLLAIFADGSKCGLQNPGQFVALSGAKSNPESILLKHSGLHVELRIDHQGDMGSQDFSGIDDIQLESRLINILDCSDNTGASSAIDKIDCYRNWLGLIKGSLTATTVDKEKTRTRHLNHRRLFTARDGGTYQLPGCSTPVIRCAGFSEQSHFINPRGDMPIAQCIIDVFMCALIASLQKKNHSMVKRDDSIDIVNTDLRSKTEMRFFHSFFSRIENILQLKPNTLKLGLMASESTSQLPSSAYIEAAEQRLLIIKSDFKHYQATTTQQHLDEHRNALTTHSPLLSTDKRISMDETNSIDESVMQTINYHQSIDANIDHINDQPTPTQLYTKAAS